MEHERNKQMDAQPVREGTSIQTGGKAANKGQTLPPGSFCQKPWVWLFLVKPAFPFSNNLRGIRCCQRDKELSGNSPARLRR